MVNLTDAAPSGTTLETLRNQSSQFRRSRPPDLNMHGGEAARVPLRDAEKLNRRESKLGLKNIFGRHKDKSNAEPEGAIVSPRDMLQRPGGLRASFAELSNNWPYSSHGARSELSLSSSPPAYLNLKHKKSASTVRGQPLPPKNPRGPLATWDPPPLFQAYPQAIKHAHLPACTLPAETILRLQNSKGSMSVREGLNHSSMNLDSIQETSAEKDKARRKHRRNLSGTAFEWTTKIFVLVTSGYLLQYAGHGSFDRLPERMLHLGKDSAAFASDVIPGRHWVLQVSSVTDVDGGSTSNSSSLLSRFSFRIPEKRHASNFLMVFECAEDMDTWIAALRREIEALGGKKNLSETGKPKVEEDVLQLKSRPSQRTLVVRDPDRFSRILPADWEQGGPVQGPEIHLDVVDDLQDQSFDETSSTSAYSQDGQQLDGLRDSAHRLSFISSGQRTMVTSAGSSPACSPVRDSFASTGEELTLTELPRDHTRPRPRPNAAIIHDRRQSMQTMNQVELRVASATMPRPHSIYSNSWQPESALAYSPPVHTTPNFSVPHGAGKRYSLARSPSMDAGALASSPPQTRVHPSQSIRRPPPTALAINPRPLSFVEDQPSPLSPPPTLHEKLVENAPALSTAPDTPSMFSTWINDEEQSALEEATKTELPPRKSSFSSQGSPVQSNFQSHRRRRSSLGAPAEGRPKIALDVQGFVMPNDIPVPPLPSSFTMREPVSRSKSALGHHTRSRSPAPSSAASRRSVHGPRLSLYSQPSDKSATMLARRSGSGSDLGLDMPQFNPQDLPPRARTPSLRPSPRLSSSSQHLRLESFSQAITQRKSMSQLTTDVGPPPAPPPTCALPPIPVKTREARREAIQI